MWLLRPTSAARSSKSGVVQISLAARSTIWLIYLGFEMIWEVSDRGKIHTLNTSNFKLHEKR